MKDYRNETIFRCPECFEIPFISIGIEKKQILINSKCTNGHIIKEDLNSFIKNQNNLFHCSECKKILKEINLCKNCTKLFCKKCSEIHLKVNNHLIISINDFDKNCNIHNKKIFAFDYIKNKNICIGCDFDITKLIPEKYYLIKDSKIEKIKKKISQLKEFNKEIEKIKNEIKSNLNDIIEKEYKTLNEINKQEIYLIEKIISNYEKNKENKVNLFVNYANLKTIANFNIKNSKENQNVLIEKIRKKLSDFFQCKNILKIKNENEINEIKLGNLISDYSPDYTDSETKESNIEKEKPISKIIKEENKLIIEKNTEKNSDNENKEKKKINNDNIIITNNNKGILINEKEKKILNLIRKKEIKTLYDIIPSLNNPFIKTKEITKLTEKEYYYGEWLNNKREGRGIYINIEKKIKYVGQFKNNLFSGFGILKNSESLFIGIFNNNEKIKGKESFGKNKMIYIGEYQNNIFHGYGFLKDNNNGSYEGEWKKGKRNGIGISIFMDQIGKEIYEGEFKNDCKHGVGIIFYADGSKLSGEWFNDINHGKGIYYSKSGKKIMNGIWNKGEIVFWKKRIDNNDDNDNKKLINFKRIRSKKNSDLGKIYKNKKKYIYNIKKDKNHNDNQIENKNKKKGKIKNKKNNIKKIFSLKKIKKKNKKEVKINDKNNNKDIDIDEEKNEQLNNSFNKENLNESIIPRVPIKLYAKKHFVTKS